MNIQGSCYCGRVRFSAVSHTPYPYMRCYCSICRKTGGGGGYAINIMAQADTLKVEQDGTLEFHQALTEHEEVPGQMTQSPARRYFCGRCGSALWLADPRWAQWFYPFASAIDTPLPKPPETLHIMLDFAAPWVEVPRGDDDIRFPRYPQESIIDWHKRHGLYQP
jgi:hypothetical protein